MQQCHTDIVPLNDERKAARFFGELLTQTSVHNVQENAVKWSIVISLS